MTTPERGDPGVQNERTALAWHRTALSVLVTSAVVSRLAMESIGPVALVALAVSGAVAVWILLASRHRYHRQLNWLSEEPSGRRDGRLPFAVAAVVTLMMLVLAAAVVV